MTDDGHHHFDVCPAKPEIDNLKRWQEDQNGKLGRLADGIEKLAEAETRRSTYEGLVKWVIGVAGFSGVVGIIDIIKGVI